MLNILLFVVVVVGLPLNIVTAILGIHFCDKQPGEKKLETAIRHGINCGYITIAVVAFGAAMGTFLWFFGPHQ